MFICVVTLSCIILGHSYCLLAYKGTAHDASVTSYAIAYDHAVNSGLFQFTFVL
jgi:hypothetical protein